MLRITDVLIEGLIRTVTAYDRQQQHPQRMHLHHHTRWVAYEVLDGAKLRNLIRTINTCGVQFWVWALQWGKEYLLGLRERHQMSSAQRHNQTALNEDVVLLKNEGTAHCC